MKLERIYTILIMFLLVSLIVSCGKQESVEGYGVLLQDANPVYDTSSFKGMKPVKYLSYGTIVEIIKNDEKLPDYSKKIKVDGKVYYISSDYITPVKRITSLSRHYYAITQGIIRYPSGSGVYEKIEKSYDAKTNLVLTPSGWKKVNWGETFYILFTPDKDITPAKLFTNFSVDYKEASKYYYLVANVGNPDFIGYVSAASILPDVVAGVVIEDGATVVSAPSDVPYVLGSLDSFDLVAVKSQKSGDYYQIVSIPFASGKVSKSKEVYIRASLVSTQSADVAISSFLRENFTNISNFDSLEDKMKAFILTTLKQYLDNNTSNTSSSIYKKVWSIYSSISGVSYTPEESSESDSSEHSSEDNYEEDGSE